MLQAPTVHQNLVQLLLQLLAIGQAGEEIVLGHALQTVLGLMAQMGIALDRCQQLVGGVHPKAELVLLMAFDQWDLMLAGAIRIDLGEVFDDFGEWLGQQPVVDQVQHQPHGKRSKHAGDEDDHGIDQKVFAIGRRIEGDVEVAVIFTVGPPAYQLRGVATLLAKNQVGEPTQGHVLQGSGLFCQHRLVGVADGGHSNRLVLKQAFHDLHAHFSVQAVDRLCGRIAEHVENTLGVIVDGLACLVGVIDDLRTAEHDADR